MNKRVLVINGPNLNLLGLREPEIYGAITEKELIRILKKEASSAGAVIEYYQSNHEGRLIDKLHSVIGKQYSGIVINPGAFTHYSYAIYDAIKAINMRVIEVHLSKIEEREEFRKISVIKPACIMQISGKGINSYIEAIRILIDMYLNP